MARNKKNVLVGAPNLKIGGGFFIGEVIDDEKKFPTDASAKLADDFNAEPGGYMSEEGLVKTTDRSTEKIKDWNGDIILVVTTDHSVVLKFTCMESANAAVLKMIYGPDNVTVSEDKKSVSIVETGEDLPHVSLDFLMVGGQGRKIRAFAPDGQVTSVGDVSFIKNDVIKYECEVEVFDIFGDGRKLWQHMDLGAGDSTEGGNGDDTGDDTGDGGEDAEGNA